MADEDKKPTTKTVDEKAQENRQKVESRVVDSTTGEKPDEKTVQNERKQKTQSQRQRTEALKEQEEAGREARENSEVYVNENGQIIDDYGTFPTPDENDFGGTVAGNREKRRFIEQGKQQQALREFQKTQAEEAQKENDKKNK